MREKEKKRGPCNRADFSSKPSGLSLWVPDCASNTVESPPYLTIHWAELHWCVSNAFSVSLLCSWMDETSLILEALSKGYRQFYFLILFTFWFLNCAWSKPPKLDCCTPIISPSCKVTAQQSILYFPFPETIIIINVSCTEYSVLPIP